MGRKYSRIILTVVLSCTLCANWAKAQDTNLLKPGVLVLPFQAWPGVPPDQVTLGLAVQNVIENMLTLHSDLEEVWANWHFTKLFPQEADFQAWIRGTGETPSAIQDLGFHYLLTGKVRLSEQTVTAELEFVDRTTNKTQRTELPLDLPGLQHFRHGVLELLARAGIPAPESQQAKMLWPEDLSLPAFLLLGRGLADSYATNAYHNKNPAWNVTPFAEGVARSPRSYLLVNSLGWVVYKQRRYPEASTRFERALALNPAGADAAAGLQACAIQTGNEPLAERWTVKKAEMQGKDSEAALAQLWNQRGNRAYGKKDYETAIKQYQRAIALNPNLVVYVTNVAGAYRRAEKFAEGQKVLAAALTKFPSPEDQKALSLALADVHFSWAETLKSKYAYNDAIHHYQAAFEIDKVYRRKRAAIDLNNIGYAYRALGQSGTAIDYYEQALAIRREVKDRAGEGVTLNNLGAAYQSLSQYETAIAYYEQALAIRREVKDRAGEGGTLNNLMFIWKTGHKPRLAIFYGKQAVNVYQAIRGDIQRLEKESQQSFLKANEHTYRQLADLLITQGRLPEAEQVLRMLKEEELFEFVRRDRQAVDALLQVALTKEEETWATRYQEIADRVTALGQEKAALDKQYKQQPLTSEEEERWLALETDLQAARQAFLAFLDELKQALGESQEAGRLVAALETTQNLQTTLQALGPGTVAVYTVVGQEKTWLILVAPAVHKAYEVTIPATDLNKKVLAFRDVVQNPTLDPRPLAQELYALLFQPLMADLEELQAQTVMWSLDGTLRYLPIAALYDGQQYVVERYRTAVFTLAGQSFLDQAPHPQWQAAGLGVSKAHAGFRALPGVPTELAGIIRVEAATTGVLPGMIALDEAFTQKALLGALLRQYPVVHIASHFQFQPGTETDSFLLLGDGQKLSIAELKGYSFQGVELLTLSACATALGGGAGKEVESFAALAQQSGAKAVVASLWPVADASTKELMQVFYRSREAKAGTPKGEALRQAQLALLRGQGQASATDETKRAARVIPDNGTASQPRFESDVQAPYAHPYYWAPFILIGNWQ